MPDPILTHHAIARAMERIPGCVTEDQARAALTCRAVRAAIVFGCGIVRLGTGNRVLIREGRVITVMPVDKKAGQWAYTATGGVMDARFTGT